jgi:hypothetical protein
VKRPVSRTPRTYTTERKLIETTSGRNPAQPNLDWYTKPAKDLYEHVFGRVRQVKNMQVPRRFELYTYQQAYNSRFGPALMGSLFTPAARNPSAGLYGISANVIKSCIDTACARIAKEKPRAFVLPNKGDYRLKKKCRNLTKFLDGAMHHGGVYSGGEEVFRDACIYGTGQLLIETDDGEICAHVVKVDELIIDAVDGMYDDPSEVHWVHPEPRAKLLARYPEFAKEIDQARSSWRGEMAFMGQADMVEVIRSWRKPSTPDAKDGRFAVAICTATLREGPWNKKYLPVVRFHWTPPTYGPFGDGIAKELFGAQRALSDILKGIVKSIRMFAVPRIWVNKLASVATQMVSNEISVNTYAGEKPVFDTPPAASADIYQFVQWIIDWCYKQLGLSQLSAQSEKPAGLNSGVGLRNYQDIETQRFSIVGQRWERFYMQVATIILDMAADLYGEDGGLSVKVAGRGFIETINWKDARVANDQYDIAIWPTNILPETPEGRFQAVQEFVQSGFMPKDVAISQLNIPILYDWQDQETAARDDVERCLSSILDKGKYIAPDPIGNVDLAVTLTQSEYLRAQDEGVEPFKIDLMLRFLSRALELQQAKNAPPPPMTGPGGPPPGAPPGPGGGAVGQAPAPPTAPLAQAGSGPVPVPAAA